MSRLQLFTKSFVERTPAFVGGWLAHVPFRYRLGRAYDVSATRLVEFEKATPELRKELAFRRFRSIVERAIQDNEFYRHFYRQRNFRLDQLRSFADIGLVPIVRKADLREWELERRSTARPGRLLVNTGGTSGQPLAFYLDGEAFAREWAHMHRVWSRIGYRRTDLKLTFRGKNLGTQVVRFNAVHNEYLVSAYHSQAEVQEAVEGILDKRDIKYLHGYPSAIYEFARSCEEAGSSVVHRLRSCLRGILYGSEFPAPVYRQVIERVFPVPSVSWYGHSEMAVLAYEVEEPFSYAPMHSYGFVEAVADDDGRHHLVGTSYDNDASPFIRYDTGDIVVPYFEKGLLSRFQIADGRIGEFVLDRDGNRVSLTALIFGRHHELFRFADHIQVRQSEPGRATILVVSRDESKTPGEWARQFDGSDVGIEFNFERIDAPLRSRGGKLPLLVKTEPAGGDIHIGGAPAVTS